MTVAAEEWVDPGDAYSLETLYQESEFRAIAVLTSDIPSDQLTGFLHFCEGYAFIRHPEKGRIKFDPFEAQIEAAQTFFSNRYSLVLKARQIGFSTLVALYSLWHAAFHRDRPILMLSRTERDAIKLLQKAKYALQYLPEWMKERLGPYSMTQTKIVFSNGSDIESLPSTNPARGESAYLIIVDELAFLLNSQEAWSAIEPAADIGGRVVMLSTANGEGNLFHELWVAATAGNNRFEPLFFPWSAADRDQDWYDAKATDLPEWQMAQEYPDDADEAFLKSGRPVFDLRILRAIETRDPKSKGHINTEGEFIPDGGDLWIWDEPEADEKYVIGADVAQGFEHGDFSVATVIACRSAKVVAVFHAHIDPDLFATVVLARLGKMYNQALIGVESNQHGLTTLKELANKAKYFPIYYQRSPKYKRSVPTDVLGFRTDQVSKPLIIDGLNKAMREGLLIPDSNTIAELKTFTRKSTGKTGGSPYDDRTMALAIGNEMRRFVYFAEFTPDKTPQPGTFGWWEKQLYGQTFSELIESGPAELPWGKRPKRKPIGEHYVRAGRPW
jgi:hypothetical protein